VSQTWQAQHQLSLQNEKHQSDVRIPAFCLEVFWHKHQFQSKYRHAIKKVRVLFSWHFLEGRHTISSLFCYNFVHLFSERDDGSDADNTLEDGEILTADKVDVVDAKEASEVPSSSPSSSSSSNEASG